MTSHNAPTLEVSLAAIARNYTLLQQKAGGRAAAVVKADAYGLGADEVAATLHDAGCRDFFVATLEEAIALRTGLDKNIETRILESDVAIFVFHGVRAGQEKDFTHHRLIPVLNSLEQIARWKDAGPAALHIDTGMRRLGLTSQEAAALAREGKAPRQLALVMSHLACANEPHHPMNEAQQREFAAVLAHFPGIPASLANSSGIFLGEEYHFALARPGCSLYGISPDISRPNPVENVVTLSAPVLQYRTLAALESIGYGATATARAGSVLATVELGYADGFLRSLSSKAHGIAAGVRVPLLGRVSMDMVTVDVSAVPPQLRDETLRVTFIGVERPVDDVAKEAGTIGYELFTRIGRRVRRVYA